MSDANWKNEKAKVERVFRQVDWKKPRPDLKLGLLNLATRMESGTSYPAKTVIVRPNHVLQYILSGTADYYKEQLEALRRYEKKGLIVEIDPAEKNKPFIPPHEPTEMEKQLAAAQARIKELESKLAKEKGGK